jgi:hypothetical protein
MHVTRMTYQPSNGIVYVLIALYDRALEIQILDYDLLYDS